MKYTLFIILLLVFTSLFAQEDKESKRSFISPGIELGMSYMNPEEANSVFNSWLYERYDVIEEFSGGIHLSVSVTGYVSVSPVEFFEIRPQYEISYAPYLLFASDGTRMNINIVSHSPGATAGFILGSFRFGGGISNYSSTVEWYDLVGKNDDKWKGTALSYQFYIGFQSRPYNKTGFSLKLCYQNTVIDQLKDSAGQVVKNSSGLNDLSLNLSGIALKFGFHFNL
ncbi:MAG: hypothetical protein EP310_07455 [Bacteroidetes bacterium]|nr:MAG: hypothetical protein EP310_07455 [Bacteroidota bacterium]